LLEAHPELIVVEEYSSTPVACRRCRAGSLLENVAPFDCELQHPSG
jgi:hypothetical protein